MNKFIISISLALSAGSLVVHGAGSGRFPIFIRSQEGLVEEIEVPSDATANWLYAHLRNSHLLRGTDTLMFQGNTIHQDNSPLADLDLLAEAVLDVEPGAVTSILFIDQVLEGNIDRSYFGAVSSGGFMAFIQDCRRRQHVNDQLFAEQCAANKICQVPGSLLREIGMFHCKNGEIDTIRLKPRYNYFRPYTSITLQPIPVSVAHVEIGSGVDFVDLKGLQMHWRLESIAVFGVKLSTSVFRDLKGTSVRDLRLNVNDIQSIDWESIESTNIQILDVGDNPVRIDLSRIRRSSPLRRLIVKKRSQIKQMENFGLSEAALKSSLSEIVVIEDELPIDDVGWVRPLTVMWARPALRPLIGGAATITAHKAAQAIPKPPSKKTRFIRA